MITGCGIIILRLHGCNSLKEKRKIIKSIIGKIRNHFNVAMAEIGDNDIYQKARIGFAIVGNDRQTVNSKMDKIFNMVENLGLAEVVETDMELINL
jgi:hypothetical protein